MNFKSGRLLTWSIIFIWSIFMGVTFVSIGLGSLFPPLNTVAGPFVCPGSQMELHTQNYQVSPVESGTVLTWYCVNHVSGTKTQPNFFIINLYAGALYGLLLFLFILIGWFFYQRWGATRWGRWVVNAFVAALVIGLILLGMMPLFGVVTEAIEPTPTPDARATSIAVALETLTSKTTIDFHSTEKPLSAWNDIPVMPQATAGQQAGADQYAFMVPIDSGTIQSFYNEGLKPLGWKLEGSQFQAMKFTKGRSTLLVAYVPNADLQSWVVTLVLFP